MGKRKIALYHAFHTSLPIMAGYGFLGLTYSILAGQYAAGLFPSPASLPDGAGGSRSLHHPHPRMEKEYDVVDSSRHPLLYAAHQNLIIRISPSTQK